MSEMFDHIHESDNLIQQVKKVADEMATQQSASLPTATLPSASLPSAALPKEVLEELESVFLKRREVERAKLTDSIKVLNENCENLGKTTAALYGSIENLEREYSKLAQDYENMVESRRTAMSIPCQITCVSYVFLMVYVLKIWLSLHEIGRNIMI